MTFPIIRDAVMTALRLAPLDQFDHLADGNVVAKSRRRTAHLETLAHELGVVKSVEETGGLLVTRESLIDAGLVVAGLTKLPAFSGDLFGIRLQRVPVFNPPKVSGAGAADNEHHHHDRGNE